MAKFMLILHETPGGFQKVSPEALMQSWLSFDPKFAERFSDMFAAMTGLGTGLGGTRTPDKK